MYEVGVLYKNELRELEFTPSSSESDRRIIMNFSQPKSYQILNLIENFQLLNFKWIIEIKPFMCIIIRAFNLFYVN